MGVSGHKVDRNNNYSITTKQNEDKNFEMFFKKYFIPIFSFIWQLIHHLKLSIRCSL